MRTSGVKVLDPVLDTVQIDWLMVPIEECQDEEAEWRLISRHFRKPHEPWTPNRAFVMPVRVSPQPPTSSVLATIGAGVATVGKRLLEWLRANTTARGTGNQLAQYLKPHWVARHVPFFIAKARKNEITKKEFPR